MRLPIFRGAALVASLAFVLSGTADAQVVINEIMFQAPHAEGTPEPTGEEYIEILNAGVNPISVAGWQIDRGVSFVFGGETIQPGAILVVAADVAQFQAAHPGVANVVGGWTGRLSNSGEDIRIIDATGVTVDSVNYADQGDWAVRVRERIGGEDGWAWESLADGTGRSLELRNPALSNNAGQNWAPSAADGGTAGAPNSVASADIAPLIRNVEHAPAVPKSTDTVQVEADIDDETLGGDTITLHWRVSKQDPQDPFNQVAMEDNNANGRWEADIPAHPNGTVIEFYVEASDGTNSRTWPAPTGVGQVANCLYQVDEETIAETGAAYRLVMSVEENEQFTTINRQSDAQMNTTLIADDGSGPSIRYLCGNRPRGAGSRNRDPISHRINIPRDEPWNGITRMNLNAQYTWLQFTGMKLFTASGMAAPQTRRVQVRRNGVNFANGAQQNYGSYVHVEPLGGEFLDNNLPNDNGGNLYKKVRPDQDWSWQDGDIGQYEDDGWSKSTNSSAADWSDLDEFLRVMNQADGDPDYIAQVEAVADLDQWMRWFAAMTLLANGETNAGSGTDDDYSMYRGEVNPRFIFVPHDLDTILGRGDESTIDDPEITLFDMIERGDTLGPLVPLFNNAGIRARYFQALRTLTQTSFSKSRFDELLRNHLAGWVPQAEIDGMVNFMDARRAFVTQEVNGLLGPPPALVQATTTATLDVAHGQVMIHEVFAAGAPDAIELYNAGPGTAVLDGMTISDAGATTVPFVIPNGTSLSSGAYLSFDGGQLGFALDTDGETVTLYSAGAAVVDSVSFGLQIPGFSIGRTGASRDTWALMSPTIGAANGAAASLGNPAGLRINEWLAQAEIRFKRDYIELYNPGANPVALGGLAITDDVNNDLSPYQLPPLSYIAGSGYTVLHAVGNAAIAGEWDELPFKLSQDLDWITVLGENGVLIDQIHILQQRPDVAQGRAPDGGATHERFTFATPGLPNPLQSTQTTDLVAWDSTWRYNDTDTDLGVAWRDPSFNDAAWPTGQASLGVEDSAITVPIRTPLAFQPPTTHYFRHAFNFAGNPNTTDLSLELLMDDGGIVYLNGTEIQRLRMPAQVSHATFASDFVGDAAVEGVFAVPGGVLQAGANVVAAEVHQNDTGSSDVVFALRLSSTATSQGDPQYIAAQTILDSLRVTEIMYNPAGAVDDQEEFIEFQNVGEQAIELGGIRISDGVDFVFPPMTLDPGEYVVVVASAAGFQAKYGNVATVAGAFTGRLDNGGEVLQIQLARPFEANILCFAYDDDWYPGLSDGDGRSLSMVQPSGPIDLWGKSRGWVPSAEVDGTPGTVGPPIITSSLSADGVQGAPFFYQITAANGPESFGAIGLPAEFSFNSDTGVILGTTDVVGDFDVTISATNPSGSRQETLAVSIAPQPPPQINSALNVAAVLVAPFSYQITGTNNADSFFASGYPAWLSFDAGTGTLSGTPSAPGLFDITISASNLTGADTETLHIEVVTDPLAVALDSQGLAWRTGGNNLWFPQTEVSHDGSDAARVGPGNNDDDDWIETTITGPDTLTFWWMVTNSGGFHRTTINVTVDSTEVASAQSRSGGGGGAGPVPWQQRTVPIPAGTHVVRWNLNTFSFGNGGTAFLDEIQLASQAGLPVFTSPSSANAVIGQPFSFQLTATNSPTSFGAAPLPAGLSVDAAGLISGVPAAVGTTLLTVAATNGDGTRTDSLDLRVGVPLPQALDTPGRVWITGGDVPWFTQTEVTNDGADAGQSGVIGDNQESWVATTVAGPGTLQFWWNVSSQAGADLFRCEIDGTELFAISGSPGWAQRIIQIPSGSHELRWRFTRNASGGAGTDSAWLDQVSFTTPDSDGDGLPDAWEIEHFGTLAQDADDDFDGDGESNGSELAAFTRPDDAGDRMCIVEVAPAGGDLTELMWTSVPGQRYRVQSSRALDGWEDVGEIIEAGSATTTLMVPPPGAAVLGLVLVGEDDPARALVPTSDIGDLWRGGDEVTFASQGGDALWQSGASGVGYEGGNGDYADFFGIDVEDLMADQRTSVYLRVPFQVADPSSVASLTLRMRYDDGFAAFLNGVQIAGDNDPSPLTWQSAATGQHADQDAVVFVDYDISAFTAVLQTGANILAIQGMNDEATSSDVLAEPVLEADLAAEDVGAGFWRVIAVGP